MQDTFRGQIVSGQIHVGSPYNQLRFKDWTVKNDKKRVILTLDEPSGTQLQRFFSGAVTPYYAYQQFVFHKKKAEWVRFSFYDAREALKLEFNAVYKLTRSGEMERVGGSTKLLNKTQFRAFLDKIEDWFRENGYLFPNCEDHKKWTKSAPMVGEVYPPLKKLIELSDKNLAELQKV